MATAINDIETLIKELDKKYLYSTDKTNYGQILRGVASRTEVHDVIKDIATIAYETAKSPYFMSECKQLLYGYMNECIANVYENGGRTTLDAFCEAWINIRTHENKKTIRERIEQIAISRGLDIEKTQKDIHKTFHEFEHNYKMLKQFSYGSNGYNQYLPLSKNGAALLLKYKFDPYGLPYGLGWGSNIFTEVEREQRKARDIDSQDKYLNERRAYWSKLSAKEKDEEEKKKKKKSTKETITIVIPGIIFLGILIAIDASGLENWFIAFLLFLLWLKWLYK